MATPPRGEKRVRIESAVQGSLFAHDFLTESVVELADWQALDDAALDELDSALRDLFERFPIAQTPNESQTEDDLIWPVLGHLGWTASSLSARTCRLTPPAKPTYETGEYLQRGFPGALIG